MHPARKLNSYSDHHPLPKIFRKGRSILDCGGFPHSRFLDMAKTEGAMQVTVFNPNRKIESLAGMSPETLEDYSKNLAHVPSFENGSVYFLLDDLGVLYFSQDPLDILSGMYQLLEKDGWAWVRIPDTFWVYLENGHRVSLREFLGQRMPDLFRQIYPHEIPATLRKELSSENGFIQMRKSMRIEKLVLPLGIRTVGKPLTWNMQQPLSYVIEMMEMSSRTG